MCSLQVIFKQKITVFWLKIREQTRFIKRKLSRFLTQIREFSKRNTKKFEFSGIKSLILGVETLVFRENKNWLKKFPLVFD